MTTLRLRLLAPGATVALLAVALGACSGPERHGADPGAHWSYAGAAGPEHWARLNREFRACADGRAQSPVDLTAAVDTQLLPLEFDYAVPAQEVLHNGHTIQVPVPPGNQVTLGGRSYALKQFHFHTPSEHHVSGRSFPVEAHLVHADSSGALLVLGVFFEAGAANAALRRLWMHMPPAPGETRPLLAPLSPTELLPRSRETYRLPGSLTTPPCLEGVQWVVWHEPLTASVDQLAALAGAMGEANNRPLQPLHDRVVYR